MEDEELETYVEVPTESDYDDYEDGLVAGDYFFIGFTVALGCAVFAFFVKTISKHLKNISLKIGNKVEIGIESKDNESKENK